jgi:hypothetical protein
MKLKYSCYYSKKIRPLPGRPKGKKYSGKWGTGRDKMVVTVHVDPKLHYLARIEASAHLVMKGAGLAFQGGDRWLLDPDSKYGHGCKGQPLVAWRDVAQGNRGPSTLPFGTRLTVTDRGALPKKTLDTLYVADRFGKTANAANKAYRVDLMCGSDELQKVGWFEADIQKPWGGVDKRPTAGAQEALNILGFKDSGNNALRVDNALGRKTLYALGTWLRTTPVSSEDQLILKGCHEHPSDAAVYFELREAARRKVEG